MSTPGSKYRIMYPDRDEQSYTRVSAHACAKCGVPTEYPQRNSVSHRPLASPSSAAFGKPAIVGQRLNDMPRMLAKAVATMLHEGQ